MEKIVYVCFCTDVIHEGHLNILEQAKKMGKTYVGVLSDEAVIRYNRFFTKPLDERVALFKTVEGIEDVIVQKDIHYTDVIEQMRPDVIVHGDNWLEYPLKSIRDRVEKQLETYGGKIVDVSY